MRLPPKRWRSHTHIHTNARCTYVRMRRAYTLKHTFTRKTRANAATRSPYPATNLKTTNWQKSVLLMREFVCYGLWGTQTTLLMHYWTIDNIEIYSIMHRHTHNFHKHKHTFLWKYPTYIQITMVLTYTTYIYIFVWWSYPSIWWMVMMLRVYIDIYPNGKHLTKIFFLYFHFTLQSLHTQFFFHICWSCFCLMSSVNIRNADTMCVMWLFTQYIQLSKMHRFVFVVFLFRFLLNFLQPANKFIHNILTYNTKCTFHTNNKFVVCINNRTRSKRTK